MNPLDTLGQAFGVVGAVRDFFWISGYPTVMGDGTSMELYFGLGIRFIGVALLVACFWPIIRSLIAGVGSRFGI